MAKEKWHCAVDRVIQLSVEERRRLAGTFAVEYIDVLHAEESTLARFDVFLIHSRIPDGLLRQMARCKYIGIRAHNTDYVNGEWARSQGIALRGIPQVGQHAVAEHTFSLIFAVTKQLERSHQNVREGKWRAGLGPNLELRGRTLGVIGYGKIGSEVATIGRALGMKVLIGSNRSSGQDGHLPVDEVLRESDIVTLHASTKNHTGPLIDRDQIARMKDGAILINTARGSLLNYEALEEALLSGKLWGAGLDVYPEEPAVRQELCELPNVVCTPHLAFYTQETISNMNRHLLDGAVEYFESLPRIRHSPIQANSSP